TKRPASSTGRRGFYLSASSKINREPDNRPRADLLRLEAPREAPGMRYLSQCGDFFRECRRHFRTTGAVLPSSRFLARALVKQLRGPRGPARILEVGPGTGSVTVEIARRMLSGDRLDAVEINGHFARLLEQRVV